jgi:methylmalonyl-CoA mutase N-terminal domain/subunit
VQSMPFDEQAEEAQLERLAKYKAGRGHEQARAAALDALTKACGQRKEICERVLDCVRSAATAGEIVSAMEKVWGRYRGA